jgi:hypothetical protein
VEVITWSPSADDTEADLNDLDTGKTVDGKPYKILKYSIQLQMKETGTKYWAKMWSSEKMKSKTGMSVWSLSEPAERKALFTAQAISQSLAESFELDDNNSKAHDASKTTPQVTSALTSASTNAGPRSDKSGSSQPGRALSDRQQLSFQSNGPPSTSSNMPGSSKSSLAKVASKVSQRAERPGGVDMPSTMTARTPKQLLGKAGQANPQSTQRGVVVEGSLRDNGGKQAENMKLERNICSVLIASRLLDMLPSARGLWQGRSEMQEM